MSTSESRSGWRRAALALVSATAIAIGTVGLSAPAHADDPIGASTATITGPNAGVVGVPVTMGLQVSGTFTPGSTFTVTPSGSNSGGAGTISVPNVTAGTTASFTFVPPHVGTFTFAVSGTSSVSSPSMLVQPVSVNVSVSAPSTLQVGQAATISATVTPTTGILAPLGQIQFAIVGSGNVGQPVFLSGNSPSVASIQWTPANLGQVQFTATYIPNRINGFSDTSCVNSNCTSPVDTIQITSSGVNVYLTNPPQFFSGVANTITAVVSVVPPSGSVTFSANGQVFASNVAVQANGRASAPWTPAAAGTFTINANWVGNNGVTGGSQESVTVSAGSGQVDSIVLTPTGQASWSPNGTYQVANGVTLTFTGATSSGAPVTIADKGPCNVSGLSVTADQGNGGCILTASSPGGNGFAPNSVSYNISLVPGTQVPSFTPPASGRYRSGRVLVLESATQQDTNAGQQINWRVRPNSRSVCRVQFPNNGSVTLRLTGRGACNVVGRAAAVPGQWNALNLTRQYQSR
jgi:hypothetical protein